MNFIADRNISTGTGDGKFSPEASLTRGQFIVMLMRAYDIKADAEASDNFADAGNVYYTGYLAAAKRLGISNGVGDNRFAPGRSITRQEMFTMLYNSLKSLALLPEANTDKALADFSDGNAVADWAKKALSAMVNTGTLVSSGGKLDPAGICTRAQMAQVLYRLLNK